MSDRQTGRTTQQMMAAPFGAIFMWCNSNLGYPKALAVSVGREDLDVRPLSWMEPRNVAARKLTGLVVDHAAALSGEGYEALMYVRKRGVQEAGPTMVTKEQIDAYLAGNLSDPGATLEIEKHLKEWSERPEWHLGGRLELDNPNYAPTIIPPREGGITVTPAQVTASTGRPSTWPQAMRDLSRS